jgi:type II secretory pathway component PulJ
MVAVAVTAILVVGLLLMTHSIGRTGERERTLAEGAERTTRVLEVLRQDWRNRRQILPLDVPSREGTRSFRLLTTAPSLVGSGSRPGIQVTYTASDAGLWRHEGGIELQLSKKPVQLEFWRGAWEADAHVDSIALRVILEPGKPAVVLR